MTEEIRFSEFKVIEYLKNGVPIVIYEITEPAEVYTIPTQGVAISNGGTCVVGDLVVEPLIKE